ncbi:MAG: ferredoxin--NADP reductase [Sphingomonadales bacterium]|jgi:CDP-4-dehydro-6-deoxyglucose reductase
MALLPWQKGVIIKTEDCSPSTRRFWIQISELDRFDFKPGQFVTLDLPIHEKPNKRWRSYSIASWPDGTNVFELVIVKVENGLGTTYLFNEATVGTELTLRGALGVFTLPEDLDKELLLICTGTGIAPFRSMVHHLANHQIPFHRTHLIFGARTQADLLYYDELKALEQRLPGFHYHPTLSRETWSGRSGYVHPVYQEICQAHPPAHFYLCGWKNMIDEAITTIKAMGYDRKSIHQEIYG